jgi:hypothetical protein
MGSESKMADLGIDGCLGADRSRRHSLQNAIGRVTPRPLLPAPLKHCVSVCTSFERPDLLPLTKGRFGTQNSTLRDFGCCNITYCQRFDSLVRGNFVR